MKKYRNKPPVLAEWLLRKFLHEEDSSHRIGDFEEVFQSIVEYEGKFIAWKWYWLQVIRSILYISYHTIYWKFIMFKNYFKIAVRNLLKQKSYSFINISGFGFGLAAAFLLLIFIRHETDYDRFHENAQKIYRVACQQKGEDGKLITIAGTVSPALEDGVSGILASTRIEKAWRLENVAYGDKQFLEEKIAWVDSSFFKIFSFEILSGDPDKALREQYAVVITRSIANKIFGTENPLSKVIQINGADYQVTGVIEDFPIKSHFHFDYLISFSTIDKDVNVVNQGFSYYTYLLFDEGVTPSSVNNDFQFACAKAMEQYAAQRGIANLNASFHLQPLLDIHLRSHFQHEIEPNGNITYIYIFSLLAIFIIVIASINFINLMTARAEERAKEVGVRKVIGADRRTVIRQFLGESIFISFLAFILALIIVQLSIEPFSYVMDRQLTGIAGNLNMLPIFMLIFLFVGIFSGIYPAFYMSKFAPAQVINRFRGKRGNTFILRKVLIVMQFCIAISLAIILAFMNGQMKYISNKNLGFAHDQIIVAKSLTRKIRNHVETVKTELLNNPNIKSVSASQHIPGKQMSGQRIALKGKNSQQAIQIDEIRIASLDYLDTYGMKIIEGRNFSPSNLNDKKEAIIINETAVRALNLESAINAEVNISDTDKAIVIGVVKDFHFQSLHEKVKPIFIHFDPWFPQYLSIKLNTKNLSDGLESIKNILTKFDSNYTWDYFFMDEELGKLYETERRTYRMFSYASLLAISISLLGLFSLATFTLKQRVKEIGIRKILGASVSEIFVLLSRDLIQWVFVANLIALPIAYYICGIWLQNFAYRIDVSWWTFLLTSLFVFMVSLSVISYHTLKASIQNPVKALKYE